MGTNLSPLESSLVWGFVRGVVLRFTTKFSSVVSCSRLRRSLFVGEFRFFLFLLFCVVILCLSKRVNSVCWCVSVVVP